MKMQKYTCSSPIMKHLTGEREYTTYIAHQAAEAYVQDVLDEFSSQESKELEDLLATEDYMIEVDVQEDDGAKRRFEVSVVKNYTCYAAEVSPDANAPFCGGCCIGCPYAQSCQAVDGEDVES